MGILSDVATARNPGLNSDYQAPQAAPAPIGTPSAPVQVSTPPPPPVPQTATQTPVRDYDPNSTFGQYLNSHPGTENAYTYVSTLMQQYGLDLGDFVKNLIVQGVNNGDAIIQRIRETPQYKTRFSGLIERQQKGLAPISEADAVALERSYEQQLRMAGVADGMVTNDDYQKLIAGDVSSQEFGQRILQGYVDLQTQPPETLQAFKDFGFAGDGPLLSYMLDPNRAAPLLQQQVAAAKLTGTSVRSGFGGLNSSEAMRLAGMGVTDSQAQQGFAQLALQQSLMNPLASEQGGISTDTALAAQFEGNAAATQQLATRRSERQSGFQGGGGYQTTKSGRTGAGSAQ